MGADNSKPTESEIVAAQREAAIQAQLRALQEENAKLLESQRLEQLHREHRAREDEKLKQERNKWKLEEEKKQKLLQEKQAQALEHQQHQPVHQQHMQQAQQSVPQPPVQQVPQPLIQQVPQPVMYQVPPLQFQQPPPPLLYPQLPPQSQFHQVPLSPFSQASQQAWNMGQPLLDHASQQHAPVLKPHEPRPRLPSAQPKSRTSKSVGKPHEKTSTSETKVVRQSKVRSRSTSVQEVPVNMSVEWKDADYIHEIHGMQVCIAEKIISLFTEKNTIPFIARYRKDVTLGMDIYQLSNIKSTYEKSIRIKQKANDLIKKIYEQEPRAASFCGLIHKTKSLDELMWIQSIFHSRSSELEEACRNGLNVPAEAIIRGQVIYPLHIYVKQGINGLNSKQEVTDGIVYILAEMIFKNEKTFKKLIYLRKKYPTKILVTKIKQTPKERKDTKMRNQNSDHKYDAYNNFSSLETDLKPHNIWEIIRGEELKVLTVNINFPAEFETNFKEYCAREYDNACCTSSVHKSLLTLAYDYAWDKLIKGSVGKQMMYELKDRAQVALVADFVNDAKKLLLTPPVKGVVIGIHPGVSDGCKLVVVSEMGEVFDRATIHPHDENNSGRKIEAERILAGMILLHNCTLLALNNSTNYKKTEKFLSEFLQKPAFENLQISYRIVSEKETSLCVKSNEASTEFPDFDIDFLSAISVARRLQDPMAEIVKIDSTQLCNMIRQHDVPTQQLVGKLNEVIVGVVSFVGVDVNTAPISLLCRVSGLNGSIAKNIIEWRKSSGPFRTREDLKKVRGISEKTFEQCAGFIRIIPETVVHINENISRDSLNQLDQTFIHPEDYDTARAFLAAAKCDIRQFGTKAFIFGVKLFAKQGYSTLAKKLNSTVETMKIIVDGLSMEKSCDIRKKVDESKSNETLSSFDALKIGDAFTGTVRSKAVFGLFIDIGIDRDALLHNNFTKGANLDIGQKIQVKVINMNKTRGRVGLEYIKSV